MSYLASQLQQKVPPSKTTRRQESWSKLPLEIALQTSWDQSLIFKLEQGLRLVFVLNILWSGSRVGRDFCSYTEYLVETPLKAALLSSLISYVQVCTFKLVLKNAASLLSDDDPVKVSAVAALNDLIRSVFALTPRF